MKKFKIGILGTGEFADCFIPLFKAHPFIDEVVLCDSDKTLLQTKADKHKVPRSFCSIDELCMSDIDAVAIFTNRYTHAPLAIQALKAGKNVYSAVPAGITVAELEELADTVNKTGLLYMMGETSYYYPCAIYCRKRFKEGAFGKFVYGEGEYYHEFDHGFYKVFQREGENWKKHAGIPPMLYPSHSVAMVLSVTGARITHASCLGFKDSHEDGLFRKGVNIWDNVFSNQTALCRTSDGGICRINEFRRVGIGSKVGACIYGTEGSYEEQALAKVWRNKKGPPNDITDMLTCDNIPADKKEIQGLDKTLADDYFKGTSKVHDVERLPKEFAGLSNGHFGSHQFLVDDFAKAMAQGVLPPNNIWEAARYCLPGIIAHESSKQEGKMLAVPDLGDPPTVTHF